MAHGAEPRKSAVLEAFVRACYSILTRKNPQEPERLRFTDMAHPLNYCITIGKISNNKSETIKR